MEHLLGSVIVCESEPSCDIHNTQQAKITQLTGMPVCVPAALATRLACLHLFYTTTLIFFGIP